MWYMGVWVLASPSSLNHLEVAPAKANAGLKKSCSSPGRPQPIPEANAVSASHAVWKFMCCRGCSAWYS